jgi:predicted restriction endonuclease
MWVYRVEAIAEPREMMEVRHELIDQRQRIHIQMEDHVDHIRSERERISRYMVSDIELRSEIRDILDSIEKICGAYA